MSFSGDISKFANKTEAIATIIFKKVSFDMYSNIIKRTPVDTGRAKGNWQMSVKSPPSQILEDTDQSTLGTASSKNLSEGSRVSNRAKLGDRLFIINNLPYIEKLEKGNSRQAPSGMVRLETMEFKRRVKAAVKASK